MNISFLPNIYIKSAQKNLIFCILLITAFIFSNPVKSRADELITDISKHLISIRSDFAGEELLLFGAITKDEGGFSYADNDLVIVIRGPSSEAKIRKKKKLGPIWVNYYEQNYEDVPGYYRVISTRPLAQIIDKEELERYQIGTKFLKLENYISKKALKTSSLIAKEITDNVDATDFNEALIRIQKNKGLYIEESGTIVFIGSSLFKVIIDFPANVPVGVYIAESYLIEKGKIIHAQSSPLYISKVDFERNIYNLAQNNGLIYGVIAVIIAITAGWMAAVVFRKN